MNYLPGDPMEPMQVELFAASLRADSTDIKAFMEALAVKLQGSLPNQTTVARQSGFFAKEHPVREIAVTLGDYQYRIAREKQGPIITQRAKVVRGIVLKTDQIPLEQWINELAASLAEEASNSASAHAALERFLLQ
ncbi:MAG TPA: hypothetical protein VNG51_28990 [Ktedonobacteraceae bacterium]|nr:hypothetical protein [Ktedonobacteraceae bacterium]